MRIGRTVGAASAGLLSAALMSGATLASATPDPAPESGDPGITMSCFVENPSPRASWMKTLPYSAGQHDAATAFFHAYGEHLVVEDRKSNGWRAVVDLQICKNGQYTHYGTYDSGPDEGRVDREEYDLSFAEGRKLRIMVCEQQGSDRRFCSSWLDVYA